MAISDELYKELIIQHSQNPSHRGHLEAPSVTEHGVNRSCGDEIELELLVQEGVIKDIRINGRGCSISTASASLMADCVDGMTLEQAENLIENFKGMIIENRAVDFPEEFEDLEALKGVQKYPIRVKCATLSWNTLEQAIEKAVKM